MSHIVTVTFVPQMVTKPPEESDGQIHLTDDEEEDLCCFWDMAIDKVVYCSRFPFVHYIIITFWLCALYANSIPIK